MIKQSIGKLNVAKPQKSIDLKAEKPRGARNEVSAIGFVAVTSEERANPSTILHNSCYMAKRTRSEAEGI